MARARASPAPTELRGHRPRGPTGGGHWQRLGRGPGTGRGGWGEAKHWQRLGRGRHWQRLGQSQALTASVCSTGRPRCGSSCAARTWRRCRPPTWASRAGRAVRGPEASLARSGSTAASPRGHRPGSGQGRAGRLVGQGWRAGPRWGLPLPLCGSGLTAAETGCCGSRGCTCRARAYREGAPEPVHSPAPQAGRALWARSVLPSLSPFQCAHARTHTRTLAYIHTRAHIHTCAYTRTHTCIHTHAYRRAHRHTCTHMHAHTGLRVLSRPL